MVNFLIAIKKKYSYIFTIHKNIFVNDFIYGTLACDDGAPIYKYMVCFMLFVQCIIFYHNSHKSVHFDFHTFPTLGHRRSVFSFSQILHFQVFSIVKISSSTSNLKVNS